MNQAQRFFILDCISEGNSNLKNRNMDKKDQNYAMGDQIYNTIQSG